jgi:hypothetical protein
MSFNAYFRTVDHPAGKTYNKGRQFCLSLATIADQQTYKYLKPQRREYGGMGPWIFPYMKKYILSRWKPYLKSPILLLEKRVKKLKYTLLEWFGWVGGGWDGVGGERGPFLKMMNVEDPGLVLAFKFYFSRRIDRGSARKGN